MKTERTCGSLLLPHLFCLAALFTLSVTNVSAQQAGLIAGAELTMEMSGTLAHGDYAPLWLSANRYGLSSVQTSSAYERLMMVRPEETDSSKSLRLSYGLDVALTQHSVSSFMVNQAYVGAAYKKLRVTLGSQRRPIPLRNQELTSGGLSFGNNALPIPQARLDIDYFDLFGTHGWWTWRGWVAYGWLTDNSYVNRYKEDGKRYTLNTLYHEKGVFWKFGRTEVFPLQFEIGLQMAAEWGGTTYNGSGRNHQEPTTMRHKRDLGALWDILLAAGSDETDGVDKNTQGNHLGSYSMALTYRNPRDWGARAYFERYFEDQSMLTVQYGISDHLLGLEIDLPRQWPVNGIVVEHLSTRSQSGAVYHDKTATLPEKMNGRDNYYNHSLYNGWQHWGQTPGHPFLTSPIYNKTKVYDTAGQIVFRNNRVTAWHIALSGQPLPSLRYRLLCSVTRNWGTYEQPFDQVYKQNYFLAELTYTPVWLPGWCGCFAVAADHGGLLGNSTGAQMTLSRKFLL